MDLKKLRTKIFCDSANLADMRLMKSFGVVSGFTTNPSLCRKAGVVDYFEFCNQAVKEFGDYSISLEVIADEPNEIIRQAKKLHGLGGCVFVKVPIVNTEGKSNAPVIKELVAEGVNVNATAIFTVDQVDDAVNALGSRFPGYVSVFAGRVADAGRNPIPYIRNAVETVKGTELQVIWASVREPYNVIQAHDNNCHVVTVFPEMLKKLALFGTDLFDFSVDTSRMFYGDAVSAGYTL